MRYAAALLLAALALAAGLALADPLVRAAAAEDPPPAALQGFSEVQESELGRFRWSLPKSALDLGGMQRRPLLLTLRMAAPRPPLAPPAVTFLTDDQWRLGDFTVRPEWRRYQILLPASDAPVKLRATPFTPGETDQRQLGIALDTLAAAPTALAPAAEHAWAILGAPRAATLLLLPLLALALLRGIAPTDGNDNGRVEPQHLASLPPASPPHASPPHDSRSSVLGPRSSVLGPRFLVLGSWSSVLGPRSSVLGPRSSVLGPRSSVLGSWFVVLGSWLVALVAAATPLRAAALIPEAWTLPAGLTLALALAPATPVLAAAARRAQALPERAQLALIIGLALAQGLLFLRAAPPWQHYDEPSHFEYARLVADTGARPAFGASDTPTQREITASMVASGFYADEVPLPPLLSDDGGMYLSGGGTATGHPPSYYAIVAAPLRLARYLDVTTQLMLARGVSLLFYLLAVAAAAGASRELAPPGSRVRWLLPLTVLLLASYADLMTAVSNDAPAAACVSLFLWGATRAIRRGVTWARLVWIGVAALAAAAFKNTGAVALALAPAAVVLAFWAQRGWRWRWLVIPALASAAVVTLATLAWDDAAGWYRWSWPAQPAATRAAVPEAPVGTHAMQLQVQPESNIQQLSSPLLATNLEQLRGRRATVGAWIWATRPVTVSHGVLVNTGARDEPRTRPVALGTTPQFFAWIVNVPADAGRLQYLVATDAWGERFDVFVDGAVVVRGRYPLDQPPHFDGPEGAAGTWGERPFVNLLRNGSAEQPGPRLRPWIDQPLTAYARRPASTTVVSVLDIERTGRLTFLQIAPGLADQLFTRFGWGASLLPGAGWELLFRLIVAAALLGCLLSAPRIARQERLGPAVAFLALVGVAVWGNTLLRIHPLIDAQPLTAARYAFPAIIPTALGLAAGWVALWPRRHRAYATAVLLGGLLLLDALVLARMLERASG